MKNSNYLSKLAICLTAPAICAWLLAGRDLSAEMFFGAYTLAGLCYLAMADYSTHRTSHIGTANAKPRHAFLRASITRTSRTRLTHRVEKIHA